MKLNSRFFDGVDEAIGAAGDLVREDGLAAQDRQVLANFYNGREIMSEQEAEHENVSDVINHLFGYNALNGFRLQIGSIYKAGPTLWNVELADEIPPQDKHAHETEMATTSTKIIRKSRRLKPEFNSMSGDAVLHGRAVLMFKDNFDWCPRISHVYVPKGTGTVAADIPYAFVADKIPYWQLKQLQKEAASGKGGKWDKKSLDSAIEYLESHGAVSLSTESIKYGEEEEQQHENSDEQMGVDEETAMSLPVWYLYEVNHENPTLPVDLRIITRYDLIGPTKDAPLRNQKPMDDVLFAEDGHFKNIKRWIFPLFMDTEIGGRATWHSATGVGRLNYQRDGDVEEFFNLAMDGAKDKMRTKWQVRDGASREKLQRFFSERQDVVPEGLTPVEMKHDPNYQHAFGIINVLKQSSKEEAGGSISNVGQENEELEIQAAERQQKTGFQVSARMEDVYEMLDELGEEVLRRFCLAPLDKKRRGYKEIKKFRDRMLDKEIPIEHYAETDEFGDFKRMSIKTSRAAGDGSQVAQMVSNQKLMSWLGLFPPEGQEIIKRKVVTDETRDPDFAEQIVPFEAKPDPDQLARARMENDAALTRGVVGFIPERSKDDVDMLHMPEHQSALQAEVAKGTHKGFFDITEAKGFQSLATHYMVHIRQVQASNVNDEMANNHMQELQKLTRQAENLQKQGEAKVEQEESNQMEKEKFDLERQKFAFGLQQHQDLQADRAARNDLDSQRLALDAAVKTSDSATKAAAISTRQETQNNGGE